MATTKNDPPALSTPPAVPEHQDADDRMRHLEAENARLRAEVDRLQAAGAPARVKFERPSFGLSAGEANDLQLHGVTTSPFTGERINAHDEGVTPATDDALAAADRERDKAKGDK